MTTLVYQIVGEHRVILTLGGAAALLLYSALIYLEVWSPRPCNPQKPDEYATRYLGAWQAIPWSIILFALVLFVGMTLYSLYAIAHPNSW